jgi:hypothetical protein
LEAQTHVLSVVAPPVPAAPAPRYQHFGLMTRQKIARFHHHAAQKMLALISLYTRG